MRPRNASEPKFVMAKTLLNEILFVGKPRDKADI